VRNDQVDAEQFRLGEHDAGVDEDRRLAAGDEHHVHAELAEPAERDQLEWRHTTSGLRTVSHTLKIPLDDTDMRRQGMPRPAPHRWIVHPAAAGTEAGNAGNYSTAAAK